MRPGCATRRSLRTPFPQTDVHPHRSDLIRPEMLTSIAGGNIAQPLESSQPRERGYQEHRLGGSERESWRRLVFGGCAGCATTAGGGLRSSASPPSWYCGGFTRRHLVAGSRSSSAGTGFSTPQQPNPSPRGGGRMPSHSPRASAAMTASRSSRASSQCSARVHSMNQDS